MRFYLFISMLLCVLSANSQSKKGFEIDNYKHTINSEDHYVTFFTTGDLVRPTSLKTDRLYFWYSNNQIKSTQGGYSGKLLHGLYTDFYANRSMKEQGMFKSGLKEGKWNTWNVDGVLIATTTYKNGIADGSFFKYDNSGKLKEWGTYLNGKLDGVQKQYFNADSIHITKYKNGREILTDTAKKVKENK